MSRTFFNFKNISLYFFTAMEYYTINTNSTLTSAVKNNINKL